MLFKIGFSVRQNKERKQINVNQVVSGVLTDTVNPRISARDAYFKLRTRLGEGAHSRGGTYLNIQFYRITFALKNQHNVSIKYKVVYIVVHQIVKCNLQLKGTCFLVL